jgi:hypothetical protein
VLSAAGLLSLILLGAGLTVPAPAAAANGYQMSATTAYVMNPDAGRLEVTISVTFKNTTPDKGSTYYYYDTVTLAFEHTATALKATTDSGGASISRLDALNPYYDRYRVRLTSPILYGVTRRVTVTYQVPSGAPRSDSPVRVGRAYANYCVIANGVDSASVSVSVPDRFVMATTDGSSSLTSSTEGGRIVFRSGTLSNPGGFWSCLSGADAASFTTTTITSASGRQIVLQSWPEDTAWRDQVSGELTQAVAALEQLIGRVLPGSGPITVREVGEAGLGGYAGGFDYLTNQAQISERIDPGLVAHELAHAWFNRGLFRETWLSEGSAEWASSQVGGAACQDPGPPAGSAALSSWVYLDPLATSTTFAAVRYEYDAACFVVASAASQVGIDRMDDVIGSLVDGLIAYQAPDGGLKRSSGPITWREWVDAIDELGLFPAGNGAAIDAVRDQLLRNRVITAADAALFQPRAEAREKYHALAGELGTTWKAPTAILRAMADWRFIEATNGITSAETIWASVNETARILPEANALTGPVRAMFENAATLTELAAAQRRAMDQQTAAELVAGVKARATAARADVVKLGLSGKDLASALQDAVAAVAAADLERTTPAVAAIDKALSDEASAAASMAGAKDRLDAPRDPLASLGLMGTDLQPTFDAGVAAVVAGDPGTAAAAAATIEAALDGAAQQGAIRLAIVLGVLLLAAVVVYLVARRRRHRPGGGAPSPALALADSAAALVEPPPDTATQLGTVTTPLTPAVPDDGAPTGPA